MNILVENEEEVNKKYICEHPKKSLFIQVTNNNLDYNFIICRCCGKMVSKKEKYNVL